MHRTRTRRILAVACVTCLVVLLGSCAGLYLAIAHGAIKPSDMDAYIGPFHFVTRSTPEIQCPPIEMPFSFGCYAYIRTAIPRTYQIWLYLDDQKPRDVRGATAQLLIRIQIPLDTSAQPASTQHAP